MENGINKLNDYINGIDMKSESGELKSTLSENTERCKAMLAEVAEIKSKCLNDKLADVVTTDFNIIVNDLKDKTYSLQSELHKVYADVEDLNRHFKTKQKCKIFVSQPASDLVRWSVQIVR